MVDTYYSLCISYCTRFSTRIDYFHTFSNLITKVLLLDFHFTDGKVKIRDIK